MKADTLLTWDKAELASILAERLADAEVLVEAFPSIEKASGLEEGLLSDFIEQNWKMILHEYDIQELECWLEEKEYEEMWEAWQNECLEDDHEYGEYKMEEYCWELINLAFSLRCKDLAEEKGYFSKFRKS